MLIVGGGISGLTLGIALRRTGIEVEIVETKQDLRQQAGVGLSLQGNCIAALARIGVANACLEKGMPNSYINLRRPDGALLASQPIIPMGGPEFPGTAGILRNDLHAILLAAASEAGVKMRMGLSFKSFDSDQSGVEVEFTDEFTPVREPRYFRRSVPSPAARLCGARECRGRSTSSQQSSMWEAHSAS